MQSGEQKALGTCQMALRKEIRGEVYPLTNECMSVLFMAASIRTAKVRHFCFHLPLVANLRILDSKDVTKT